MVIEKATDTQIQEFINRYDSWSIVDCKLHREYVFSKFLAL
jgi:pterin-4a-carbinolamine dehydratase